jgi:proteasome assembly chaperone (PAC2) family protein
MPRARKPIAQLLSPLSPEEPVENKKEGNKMCDLANKAVCIALGVSEDFFKPQSAEAAKKLEVSKKLMADIVVAALKESCQEMEEIIAILKKRQASKGCE